MFETLEPRQLLSSGLGAGGVRAGGGLSSSSLLDIEGTAGIDRITVKLSGASLDVVINGGSAQSFSTASFTQLLINGGDGDDQIEFDGAGSANVTVRGGNGNDQILFGNASQQLNDVGQLNQVEGGAGTDNIVLYDNNSTDGHSYTITQTLISRDEINTVSYAADLENVTLYTSRGTSTVNIISSHAGTITTAINGGGTDTFNVGGSDGVQSIDGFLQLQSLSGSTQMIINDAGDFTGRSVTMAQSDSDHGLIYGLAPANISYQYSRTTNLTFVAGDAVDTIQIYATGAPTTISNDQSDDRVFVGDGTSGVQAIRGALLVTNPFDDTTLNINDAVDTTGREFSLDNNGTLATLTGLSPATIQWTLQDVLNVNLTSSSALDIFQLRRSVWNLNYNGYGGTDNIFVGANSGVGVQGITGTVSLNNTNSFNFIQFNDDPDTTSRNISLTNTNVGGVNYEQSTGLIPGVVRYNLQDTAGVTYFTGKASDTITVPSSSVPLRFGSTGGNDLVTLGNGTLQGITATVSTALYGGYIRLTLDDSTDTVGRTISHDLIPSGSSLIGQITGLAPAPISYDPAGVTTVMLRPGAGTDTINVNESAAGVPLTLRSSAGFDTVNVNTDSAGSAQVLFAETQKLGALTIGASGKAILSGTSSVLSTKALLLANGATLDLNDNDLLLDYTGQSPLANIQALITQARTGGTWNGTGITSTVAHNAFPNPVTLGLMEATDYKSIAAQNTSFDGQTLDNTALLIKFTYYGDADFNGVVNFDDYSRTDAGFNGHKSGWLNGDFDGNGHVDFDDYSLIDLAFNTQAGAL